MMRKLSLYLVVILLAGCAYKYGTVVKDTTAAQIVKGKTTKVEVRQLLGKPTGTGRDADGHEVWRYGGLEGTPKAQSFIPYIGPLIGGSDYKTTDFRVTFDSNGVVLAYSHETFEGEGGTAYQRGRTR